MTVTEHILWCRQMFAALMEDGVWGVPRSGLVFRRRGESLVLTEIMPHEPEMPLSPRGLLRWQAEDYATIKRHFETASIPVRRELARSGRA